VNTTKLPEESTATQPAKTHTTSDREEKSAPKLQWKLLTKKRAGATQGLPAGKENLAWVTNTVTLIYGERDAILVDTFLSVQHSKELLDWVAESGKNLTTIYVTHAHGDHFFGLKSLLDRFPTARAFATASVVEGINTDKSGLYKILLGTALSWASSVAVGPAGSPRRRHLLS
jgi:glyoxylase-like metal-dependent hydrolase (beta-lactamase superfamily II)